MPKGILKNGINIENIQPLCRSCNSRKHDRVIDFNQFFGETIKL